MSAGHLDAQRLEHLRWAIADDLERERYYGAVIAVARGGRIGLHAAVGFADAASRQPLAPDSVFSIFSVTKAITNVLVLRAIELGHFALTTRISDLIPEFSGGLRNQIEVQHLLTHTSGLPIIFALEPKLPIDRLDVMVEAVCTKVEPAEPAGEHVAYSPLVNHVLLGEALRRTDPARRAYRTIVQEDLFTPLRMHDSAVGLRRDLRARHVAPDLRGNFPITHPAHDASLGPNGAFLEERAEMPWLGVVSTVPDMLRFAEMLRRGGELDGARILSPATLELATRNHTGDKPNELYKMRFQKRNWTVAPAYQGLGFALRGTALCHHLFGNLTSERTFGNHGAGSTLYWVDPEREVSFVCLTAGVMDSLENIERFQRLSDIAISAAL